MLEWLPGVFLLTLAALKARSLLRPSAPAGAPAAASRPPTPHETASPVLALGVGATIAAYALALLASRHRAPSARPAP